MSPTFFTTRPPPVSLKPETSSKRIADNRKGHPLPSLIAALQKPDPEEATGGKDGADFEPRGVVIRRVRKTILNAKQG